MNRQEIIKELESREINHEESNWYYETSKGKFHGEEVEEVLWELAHKVAVEETSTHDYGRHRRKIIEQHRVLEFHRLDHVLAGKDENGKLPKNFYVALPPMISMLVKYDQPKGCIARCQID